MAISVKWIGPGLQHLVDDPIDLEAVTVKLALVTSSQTPNQDTDEFRSVWTANELANGNGYATGGVTLSGVLWSYDVASQQVRLDFNDPSWTFTASKTWRYAYVFVDTAGADTTDPNIALLDWGANQTVSTAYTLTIDPTGLLYIDVT